MKKLATVCWSYTVEIDIPEDVNPDSLLDEYPRDPLVSEAATKAIEAAGANLNWKDGVITDIQDI